MADPIRRLAYMHDGIAPIGRVLVRAGRVALIECSPAELLGCPCDAVIWATADAVPSTVPDLEPDEQEFVAGAALATLGGVRPRDGENWDSPGTQAP